jgi:hypothetical protein
MKHFIKLLELLAAVILSAPLFTIALIYNVFKLKKYSIIPTVWKLLKELAKILFELFRILAVWIDRLGNVILFNLFIDLFLQEKNKTLFGKSEVTISAAFGHAYEWIYLNKRGLKFVKILDFIFGKNHCKDAYKWHEMKKDFDNKTGIS